MDPDVKGRSKKWLIIAAAVVVVALIAAAVYFLVSNPVRAQVVRDLFIILIALEVLAVGALLSVLTWQIYQLVRLLQREILPILDSTREATNTVKGTATFVGEHVVKPVAKASGYVAGLKAALSALATRTEPRDEG